MRLNARVFAAVLRECGQDHVQIAAYCPRCVRKRAPAGTGGFDVGHAAGEDQPILRAGQQHVEDAQLLRPILPLLALGDGQLGQGPASGLKRGIAVQTAQTQIPVGRQRLATTAAAEAPVHHRAEYHGELQALALVHGHQPHHVVVLAQQLRTVALAPGADLLRVQQKAGQRAGDALVEGGGVGDQPVQVRLTLRPARQRSRAIV